MRLLRGLAGSLLWIVSALLGLVAVVLCLTLILLPVGLPLLGYARRLFTLSMRLMLPRAVSHPIKAGEKSVDHHAKGAKKELADRTPDFKQTRKQFRRKSSRLHKVVTS